MKSRSNFQFKRVKERTIQEAQEAVLQWRNLFKNGVNEDGKKIKYSLAQAAELVGIPKKTLEDYHQLLRKASQLIDLDEICDKKMGYLRDMLRKNKQQIWDDEGEQIVESEDEQDIDYQQMIVEGDIQPIDYTALEETQYWNRLQDVLHVVLIFDNPPPVPEMKKFSQVSSDEASDYETDDDLI
ncbi:hypothetical protein pb186bvf_019765 [Paramecium bursaria]